MFVLHLFACLQHGLGLQAGGPVAVPERPETAEPVQIDEEDIVDATQDAEQVVQEKLAAIYVTSQR